MSPEMVFLWFAAGFVGGLAGAYVERWIAGWVYRRRLRQETLQRRVGATPLRAETDLRRAKSQGGPTWRL